MIKKIYTIEAIWEPGTNNVQGYPDLRLIAKCLINDGSFEANIFFYDEMVINLWGMSKELLNVSIALYSLYIQKQNVNTI
jgi:hypothetical protein